MWCYACLQKPSLPHFVLRFVSIWRVRSGHHCCHSRFPCKDPKRPRGELSCHINICILTVKWPLTTYFSLPFLSRMGSRTLRMHAGTALLQMYKNPGIYYSRVLLDFYTLYKTPNPHPFSLLSKRPFGVDPLSPLSLKHQDLQTHMALRVMTNNRAEEFGLHKASTISSS